MTKKQRRALKRSDRTKQNHDLFLEQNPVPMIRDYIPAKNCKPIEARTETQYHYMQSIKNKTVTFGVGPAGTGKTWVCGALAAEALEDGITERIIVTRPVQEAGENLGFLPGEVEDKFAPYFQPFKDVLIERLGKGHVQALMKAGRIETAPFAYMRGRTFKHCWVILDEAQNTTPEQMKLFMTRIGENCKVIVNGDYSQKDIRGQSGLEDAIKKLAAIAGCEVIEFTREDIVRSGLVQKIVEAYELPSMQRFAVV